MSGALITILVGWAFAITWILIVLFTQGKGHPKTLFLLFATEMWERFSYYGMRALLSLYVIASVSKGGLGWTTADAGHLYGVYTGLAYFTTIFGGYFADRYFGFQRAILIGGSIIAFGHACLAVDSLPAFFAGLVFLILGTGLFKPNISSMVGQLYPENSPLKDSAYTIFYMGINMGGFLGSLTCGYLGEEIGWHYGFGAAGVGMVIGLCVFYIAKSKLGSIGLKPIPLTPTEKLEKTPLTNVEKDRLKVIGLFSFFSILFWTCFEQQGASMTIFAEKNTNRFVDLFNYTIPASFFQSINPFFIIILTPLFSWLWIALVRKNIILPGNIKFAIGFILLGLGFVCIVVGSAHIPYGSPDIKANYSWLILAFFFQTAGELCLSPVGLSLVNKLAPKKFLGIMFGIWFVASSVGNYSSGAISAMMDSFSLPVFFSISVGIAGAGALLAFIFTPFFKKWMHGVS